MRTINLGGTLLLVAASGSLMLAGCQKKADTAAATADTTAPAAAAPADATTTAATPAPAADAATPGGKRNSDQTGKSQ